MRLLLSRVTDRRLTVSLFLSFLALFCLGLVLPQRPMLLPGEAEAFAERWPTLDRLATATGLDDVFHSTLMTVVFAVCCIQLLAYVALRADPVLRECRNPLAEPPERMPIQLRYPGSPARLEAADRALRSLGFPLRTTAEGARFGVKNRFSAISSLVFHLSFVVVLGGAWLLKASLFRGSLILAEGQPFTGTRAEYETVDPVGIEEEDLPRLRFTIQRLAPVFTPKGGTVDMTCEALKGEGPGTPDTFAVNRPMSMGGAEVLVHGFGLAPVFTVHSLRTGQEVDAQCVRLGVWAPGLPEDSFVLAQPAATVHVRFYPDHEEGPEGHRSRAMDQRNPALWLRVVPESGSLAPVEGLLKTGGSLEIGGHRLTLAELRTWGNFHVSRQTGWLLIAGFVVLSISIALRFFFVRQAVSLQLVESPGGPELVIGGRATFFPESLHHRLELLAAGIAEESHGNH